MRGSSRDAPIVIVRVVVAVVSLAGAVALGVLGASPELVVALAGVAAAAGVPQALVVVRAGVAAIRKARGRSVSVLEAEGSQEPHVSKGDHPVGGA